MEFFEYSLPLSDAPSVGSRVHIDGCDGFFDQSLHEALVGTERWVLVEAEDVVWECQSLDNIRSRLDFPLFKLRFESCNSIEGTARILEKVRFLDLAFSEVRYPLPSGSYFDILHKPLQQSDDFLARSDFFARNLSYLSTVCGFKHQSWYRVLVFRGNCSPSSILDFPLD